MYHVAQLRLFYFPLYLTEPNFLTRYGDAAVGGLCLRIPISFCQELKPNMSYLNRLVGKVDKHVVQNFTDAAAKVAGDAFHPLWAKLSGIKQKEWMSLRVTKLFQSHFTELIIIPYVKDVFNALLFARCVDKDNLLLFLRSICGIEERHTLDWFKKLSQNAGPNVRLLLSLSVLHDTGFDGSITFESCSILQFIGSFISNMMTTVVKGKSKWSFLLGGNLMQKKSDIFSYFMNVFEKRINYMTIKSGSYTNVFWTKCRTQYEEDNFDLYHIHLIVLLAGCLLENHIFLAPRCGKGFMSQSQAKWRILDYTDLFSLLGKINTQYGAPIESLWNFGKDKDR